MCDLIFFSLLLSVCCLIMRWLRSFFSGLVWPWMPPVTRLASFLTWRNLINVLSPFKMRFFSYACIWSLQNVTHFYKFSLATLYFDYVGLLLFLHFLSSPWSIQFVKLCRELFVLPISIPSIADDWLLVFPSLEFLFRALHCLLCFVQFLCFYSAAYVVWYLQVYLSSMFSARGFM